MHACARASYVPKVTVVPVLRPPTLHISQLLAKGYSQTDAFSLFEKKMKKLNRDSDNKQSIYSSQYSIHYLYFRIFLTQKKSH